MAKMQIYSPLSAKSQATCKKTPKNKKTCRLLECRLMDSLLRFIRHLPVPMGATYLRVYCTEHACRRVGGLSLSLPWRWVRGGADPRPEPRQCRAQHVRLPAWEPPDLQSVWGCQLQARLLILGLWALTSNWYFAPFLLTTERVLFLLFL